MCRHHLHIWKTRENIQGSVRWIDIETVSEHISARLWDRIQLAGAVTRARGPAGRWESSTEGHRALPVFGPKRQRTWCSPDTTPILDWWGDPGPPAKGQARGWRRSWPCCHRASSRHLCRTRRVLGVGFPREQAWEQTRIQLWPLFPLTWSPTPTVRGPLGLRALGWAGDSWCADGRCSRGRRGGR